MKHTSNVLDNARAEYNEQIEAIAIEITKNFKYDKYGEILYGHIKNSFDHIPYTYADLTEYAKMIVSSSVHYMRLLSYLQFSASIKEFLGLLHMRYQSLSRSWIERR